MDLKKRLNELVKKDKQTNTKYLIQVIKSDFYYILNNYFEVDFDDIDVDINNENDKYKIELKAYGDRIKVFKTLPE